MITHVRMPGPPNSGGWVAFVTLPEEEEVRVRFNRAKWKTTWVCAACGPHDEPDCPHAAAALHHVKHQPATATTGR